MGQRKSSPPGPSAQTRLAALRYRDFRLLWFGQLLAGIGSQMQLTAVNWHVFELLQDQVHTITILGHPFDLSAAALGLGLLGLVRIIPIILFALVGGMLADTRDRRRILIWTQLAATLAGAVLAALTLSGNDTMLAIYLLTAVGGATSAFASPAQQAIVPNLVRDEDLTNAVSLNTVLWNLTTIIGPALAGAVLASLSVGLAYAVSAALMGAMIITLALMHFRSAPRVARDAGLGLQPLLEGVRFTYHERIIWSTMLLDFFATFFASARTMLPIIASDILGLGAAGYGLLATAQSVGAVLAGVILSLREEIVRQGVVLLVSVAIYGVATALFGVSTSFALSYLLFALTGAGDTVSTVIRGTIRQVMTPDRLRGRMTSVNMVFFMGGPQLGELEAGLVASAFGTPFAIVTGGIATVLLTAWIAWKYPRLRDYTLETQRAHLAAAATSADR